MVADSRIYFVLRQSSTQQNFYLLCVGVADSRIRCFVGCDNIRFIDLDKTSEINAAERCYRLDGMEDLWEVC